MENKNSREQSALAAPGWVVYLTALAGAVTAGLVLWATWFFYKDIWNTPGFHWFEWIQPVLQALGAFLGLIAAALLVAQKRAGWSVFKMALGILPLILLYRLVIVVLIFMWNVPGWISQMAVRLMDGTFLDQFSQRPGKLVLIIVGTVIALLILLSWITQKYSGRSDYERKKGR